MAGAWPLLSVPWSGRLAHNLRLAWLIHVDRPGLTNLSASSIRVEKASGMTVYTIQANIAFLALLHIALCTNHQPQET